MRIITIGREFGSGGRELGKRLADELNFKYYDKEIISEIAKRAQLDENYVASKLDKGIDTSFHITFAHSFIIPYTNIDRDIKILQSEREIIHEFAQQNENFVIVGRNSDILLEKYSPFNIFVYADMKAKVERCLEHAVKNNESLTAKEIAKKIKQIDQNRAKYRELITDCKWGKKESYNLCVNTTGTDIKSLIPSVATYAQAWFTQHNL